MFQVFSHKPKYWTNDTLVVVLDDKLEDRQITWQYVWFDKFSLDQWVRHEDTVVLRARHKKDFKKNALLPLISVEKRVFVMFNMCILVFCKKMKILLLCSLSPWTVIGPMSYLDPGACVTKKGNKPISVINNYICPDNSFHFSALLTKPTNLCDDKQPELCVRAMLPSPLSVTKWSGLEPLLPSVISP